MFDSICKVLAERYPVEMAHWILGQPLALTTLSPTELSKEPIRADSLIFLQAEGILLHLEFQTDPDEEMPLRILDYWVRLRRKYPKAQIRQVVLYLRETQSERVYQTQLQEANTTHRFEIIRLWEEGSPPIPNLPGLLPFVVLSKSRDPATTLREVATALERLPDKTTRADLTAATAILAGLRLEAEAVKQILGSEFMKESVVYQEWVREAETRGIQLGKQEGIQIGEQRGIQQGKHEEASRTVNRLLRRKLGSLSSDLEARIQSLTITQLEQLVEDLLDFGSLDDLNTWIRMHG